MSIIPSAKGFSTKLNSEVGSGVKSSGTSLGKTFGKLFAVSAGVVSAAAIGNFLKGSIDEAREAQKVGAQTNAVLKSTGGVAKVSAKQIGDLASSLSAKIGVDDEAIQAGENLLLTFTNVRNEAGKGNDVFTQATRTVQDMAAAFGGDAVSNSKILGKALNDPIKGVSALTRVGVTFTDAQKDQIKTLVESGDTLGAQKIILKELAKETEGSAEAQVTASDKASVALGNLKETVGTALLPVIDRLADTFTDTVAPAVTDFVTGLQDGTGAGGEFRDVVEDIVGTVKGAAKFLDGLPGPVKEFGGEVALAALVLPRLTGALGVAKIQAFAGAVSDATTRTAALQGAAKAAAGAAGLALLIDSSRRADGAVSTLEGTLGGAALGFSVGGPVGGAIGGLAGLILSVGDAGDTAKTKAKNAYDQFAKIDPVEVANASLEGLKDTLDQVTGAYTGATRAAVLDRLEKSDALRIGAQYGIGQRELVNAALGQKGALSALNPVIDNYTSRIAALDAQQDALRATIVDSTAAGNRGLSPAIEKANAATVERIAALEEEKKANQAALEEIKKMPGALHDQGKAVRDAAAVTADYTGKLKGIPPQAKTAILQDGIIPSTKAIADLTRKYELTPKQVKTLIQASGADTSAAAVQRLIDKQNALDKRIDINVVTHFSTQGRPTKGGEVIGSPRASNERHLKLVGETAGRVFAKGVAKGINDNKAAMVNAASDSATKTGDAFGKKLKEKLGRVRDSLSSLKSDFASLVEPISSNFTQGLFDFDNATDFKANLTTVKGTLTGLIGNFKTLIADGLSPEFLYTLFEQGGPGLINSLAALPASEAQEIGGLFGQVTSLSDQLATSVAGNTKQGAQLVSEIKKTNDKLDRLIAQGDKAPDRIAEATAQPSKRARRRAFVAA